MDRFSDLLTVALDAREKGYIALPCHAGTKIPAVKWKRWQSETPPLDLQLQWFRHDSRCNIAILTSGLVIFDVDDIQKAERVLRECGDTPHKLRTPRGGVHLGYRRRAGIELGNRVQIQGLPIDIRTDGGIEMIPPSFTSDGRYSWLGEGLRHISDLPIAKIAWTRERVRWSVRAVTLDSEHSAGRRARSYIARIEGAIAGHGGHNRTMRVAGVLIQKFGLSIEQAMPLFREWNEQCEPPWTDTELMHKLTDALRLKDQQQRRY